jgi:hypothetical protein
MDKALSETILSFDLNYFFYSSGAVRCGFERVIPKIFGGRKGLVLLHFEGFVEFYTLKDGCVG